MVDNNEVTDEKLISSEIWKFYSQLVDCQIFFQDIAKHIPKVEDGLKQTCDNQITLTQLDVSLLTKPPDPTVSQVTFTDIFG